MNDLQEAIATQGSTLITLTHHISYFFWMLQKQK